MSIDTQERRGQLRGRLLTAFRWFYNACCIYILISWWAQSSMAREDGWFTLVASVVALGWLSFLVCVGTKKWFTP